MPISKTMIIEVPALPPGESSPNFHGHWSERYRASQSFRDDVYYCCYNARRALEIRHQWQPFNKARLDLTFIFPTYRCRDEDNLRARFKPGQDALVAAQLLMDDDSTHLKDGRITILIDKARAPMTIIELTEIPSGRTSGDQEKQ